MGKVGVDGGRMEHLRIVEREVGALDVVFVVFVERTVKAHGSRKEMKYSDEVSEGSGSSRSRLGTPIISIGNLTDAAIRKPVLFCALCSQTLNVQD
jgi:hypothetical protein